MNFLWKLCKTKPSEPNQLRRIVISNQLPQIKFTGGQGESAPKIEQAGGRQKIATSGIHLVYDISKKK